MKSYVENYIDSLTPEQRAEFDRMGERLAEEERIAAQGEQSLTIRTPAVLLQWGADADDLAGANALIMVGGVGIAAAAGIGWSTPTSTHGGHSLRPWPQATIEDGGLTLSLCVVFVSWRVFKLGGPLELRRV